MSKKINLLKNLIILSFVFLALLVAGVIVCTLALVNGIDTLSVTGYVAIILVCYFLSVFIIMVIFQLFAERGSLFHRQIWIKRLFDTDVTIWDDETFEREASKRLNKIRDNRITMTGVIYMHGFNNQPLFTFRQVDIFVLNEIVLNAIEKEMAGKDNWLFGINRENKYLFYGEVNSKEEFFDTLQNIVNEINAELGRRPSLPMAFVMIGANIIEKKQTIYEAVEHANTAANYDAGMRLSGDIKLFDPHMLGTRDFEKEKSLEIDKALENKQFLIYYQAKWNLKENKFYGAEALIRWRHPRRGYLPPSSFIPYAEASGKIVEIDHYVFETVCQDLARWKKERKRNLVISVNLSRRTIYDPGLINFFAETIKKYNVDPKSIEIELTESLAAQDTAFISFVIRKIKALGFSTSIDDFGVGYSSLSAIKNIDFDVLKLDKSFIDDVEVDKTSESMVASIISLVHGLKMFVIAEGVENQNQVNILAKHDLNAVQGYYFAKPLEVSEFEALIEHNKFEEEAKAKKERKAKRSKKGGEEL